MKVNSKAAVRQILTAYLEQSNHRRTPERYAILDAIYSINGHFSLEQLEHKLIEANFRVSRATLYNALRLFIALRLVVRHNFQAGTMYEASYNNVGHCHRVCTVCGKVVEVKSQEILNAVKQLHLTRFRPDGFSLCIYGICSSCQAKITRQKSSAEKKKKQNKNNEQR